MNDIAVWTAVQGIGTLLAAVAAIIALVIAGKQLGELISSNKLLASSNEAMTESNIALTRPFVTVDFEFSVSASRSGGTIGTSVFVVIKNEGRTPAHNVTLAVDHPFVASSGPDAEGWRKSIEDLNRMTNGSTILRSLTNSRPLEYYLDGVEIFGREDEPAPSWIVAARYEDAGGREFRDRFTLEIEPWRRSVAKADPLARIGKYIDSVAHEVKNLSGVVKAKRREVRVDAPHADGVAAQ